MALIDNLESYWKLDEASGNALDAHGSNELTDNNTVGSAAGKISNARDFELANSEYFSRADNASLSTGDIDFTFSAWLNFESLPVSCGILGKWGAAGSREYILYYIGGATNRLQFYVSNDGTAFTSVTASNHGAITTGTWRNVVCWHDSVNNQIGIAGNAGTANTASHTTGVSDGAQEFVIGRDSGGAPGGIYFDGLIDEVGFWKRVVTSGERTELYNGGNGLAYPFTGGAVIPVFMRQYRQRWAA